MTPSSPHRPQMTAEEFEKVARGAPETVRLEYARGGIGARLPADGDHDEIVMWLLEQFLHHRPDLRLYPGRGLKVDRGQAGRVRPDGVLAPWRHFTGQGEWADPAGVLMVAHWARAARRKIKGALLATPPDLEVLLPAGDPTIDALKAGGWLPTPRDRLPFRSIVAASSNDPLAKLGQVTALARDWGSELALLGDVGHLNPAAGFGPWPQARLLLEELDRNEAASGDQRVA